MASTKEMQARAKRKTVSPVAIHDGIDLFFRNISELDAQRFCDTLNGLDRTMGGNTLVWTLAHTDNKAAITARYPAQPYSRDYALLGLAMNRSWCETGLKALGMTGVEYTGSEFYVKFSTREQMLNFYKELA